MRFIDDKGRLFRKLNVIDLLIVLVVCLFVAVAYVKLTAPYRIAPQYPLPDSGEWIEVDIVLPSEQSWMKAFAAPGLTQLDARSGERIAQILGSHENKDGLTVVVARVRAGRDRQGRKIFDRHLLVPGQKVRIETEECVIEGYVARLAEADSPGS
jgi:hypothetical protein